MARTRANVTTDHDEIRRWAEERGAEPACVRKTGGKGDIGMIRLDFPGYSGEQSLEHISWDEWFQKFDESGLALLHQDTLATGGKSNFNKLIARETAQAREQGNNRASRRKLQSGRGRGSAQASSRQSSSRGRSASSKRASSAIAKRSTSSSRGERSARTRSASSSRSRSSAASSRGREPGRAVSRSKQAKGSQRSSRDVTRRSGPIAGRNPRRAGSGSRQAVARSTGRRSAKRNPEKVAKTARRIKQGAENIIRMERGQGSRGASRVTERGAAKTVGATARRRGNATGRRKAA